MKTPLLRFDNTARIKAEAPRNARFVAHMSAAPVLPVAKIDKPAPVVGKRAYSVYGGKGKCTFKDATGLAVDGQWMRPNEWSSVVWTDAEREAFNTATVDRSHRQAVIDAKQRATFNN